MANQPNTNTTGANDLAPEVRQFWASTLLHTAYPNFAHGKHAKKVPLPKGSGKTVRMRRVIPTAVAGDFHALTEGVTPDGQAMKEAEVTATIGQYGAYWTFSDQVNVHSVSCPILTANTENMGQHAGQTLDTIWREAFHATTNVAYCNGRAGRGNLLVTDTVTDAELMRIRYLMKKNLVPMYGNANGFYRGICSEEFYNDLMKTDAYQKTAQYQSKADLENPGPIFLYGVRWESTTQAKVIPAGTNGAPAGVDVHRCLVFGPESLGQIDPDTMGLQNIYKGLGSSGTADALNQRQTQGWKASTAGKVLNDQFTLAYECSVSIRG